MNRIFISLFCLCFLFSACETESSGTQTEPTDGTTAPADSATTSGEQGLNFNLIPGKQVGPIEADDTEAEIKQYFDAADVSRKNIGVGEGEFAKATVIYEGTPKEIIILWKSEWPYTQIDRIRIEQLGTPWKTDQGITVGTGLDELERINGKSFKFLGFEWDYAGRVSGWNGGFLNEKLGAFLVADNPEAIYPHLLGDDEFLSDNKHAKAADLKVDVIEIIF